MRRFFYTVATVTVFLCSMGTIQAETADSEVNQAKQVQPEISESISVEPETAKADMIEAPAKTVAPEKEAKEKTTPKAIQQALNTGKKEKPNPWKLRGRSETVVEWKDYNSDGSTIDKETRWRQELSLSLSRKVKTGSFGLDLRGRATDDENIDSKDARLLYLNGYFRTKNSSLEVGDVAASFNPLVLSASLKGTKVNYQSGDSREGWKTSFLGGIQKASWDAIYDEDDQEGYDRYIAGIHQENYFGTGKKLTFSSAFVTDDKNTDADDATRLETSPAEAVTIGTSWDWRFNRYVTTRGEAGFTSSDENTDDSKSDETAGAVRIKLMTKPHKKYLRSNFLYERIDTDYKPFSSSAATDREKFENDSTIMLNRQVKIRLTLKESRDNLDGSLNGTLTTDDGVFYLTLRPDWLKRGDFGLRNQFKRTHGRGTDQRINIHQADFSFRPKSGWKYGLSWIYTDINEHSDAVDGVTPEDQDIHTVRTTVGWNKRFSNDHLFRSTVRLDGNFIERDSGRQRTTGGKIDLGYDAGKYFSGDLSAGTNKTYRDASEDGQYTAYEIRGSYHPGGDRSKALRLSASKRQTYTGSETTSTENTAKLSYLFSF